MHKFIAARPDLPERLSSVDINDDEDLASLVSELTHDVREQTLRYIVVFILERGMQKSLRAVFENDQVFARVTHVRLYEYFVSKKLRTLWNEPIRGNVLHINARSFYSLKHETWMKKSLHSEYVNDIFTAYELDAWFAHHLHRVGVSTVFHLYIAHILRWHDLFRYFTRSVLLLRIPDLLFLGTFFNYHGLNDCLIAQDYAFRHPCDVVTYEPLHWSTFEFVEEEALLGHLDRATDIHENDLGRARKFLNECAMLECYRGAKIAQPFQRFLESREAQTAQRNARAIVARFQRWCPESHRFFPALVRGQILTALIIANRATHTHMRLTVDIWTELIFPYVAESVSCIRLQTL